MVKNFKSSRQFVLHYIEKNEPGLSKFKHIIGEALPVKAIEGCSAFDSTDEEDFVSSLNPVISTKDQSPSKSFLNLSCTPVQNVLYTMNLNGNFLIPLVKILFHNNVVRWK